MFISLDASGRAGGWSGRALQARRGVAKGRLARAPRAHSACPVQDRAEFERSEAGDRNRSRERAPAAAQYAGPAARARCSIRSKPGLQNERTHVIRETVPVPRIAMARTARRRRRHRSRRRAGPPRHKARSRWEHREQYTGAASRLYPGPVDTGTITQMRPGFESYQATYMSNIGLTEYSPSLGMPFHGERRRGPRSRKTHADRRTALAAGTAFPRAPAGGSSSFEERAQDLADVKNAKLFVSKGALNGSTG